MIIYNRIFSVSTSESLGNIFNYGKYMLNHAFAIGFYVKLTFDFTFLFTAVPTQASFDGIK